MAPSHYKRIVLAKRPKAAIIASTFRTEDVPFDLKPGRGQVLIGVDYVSLDPAMRGWLNNTRSYVEPVQIGAVMKAFGLGTVVEAGEGSPFKPGDRISGTVGWREYAVLDVKDLQKVVIPDGAEYLDFLGALSMTGLTAFVGLLDVGKLQPGEKLLVSGAAGATGSIVCQIGKQKGAKVYAIAGTPEKCAWLEQELGVDKALNYKSPSFHEDFKKSVGYFDIFFDNVGGEILDFALTRMNTNARIVLCGAISDYNARPKGLKGYLNLISQRAKVEGFIVFDHVDRYPAALQYLGSMLKDGTLKRKFHVVEGLENAPLALNMLFTGGNTGKL
ncbi:alcohol dehydrogenase [Laetiporus sulphureus 93-53]|uniref:Alcohol dehydrogenase n=1 Tax=Laetiporus sulphureus 93-53 TaxID=1314785 RepID=A0A165EUI2_9APHY|nr:alcohol dehydrogenase [Laetiporus sulphureus 93-53]KZT07789.1 alcohol dehydrogenase [Laetiporus sulphureus 93-53]